MAALDLAETRYLEQVSEALEHLATDKLTPQERKSVANLARSLVQEVLKEKGYRRR